ncbi:hypothetical protein EPUS_02408 [Endocarpon pusillum Z07020]|uniref:Uncharacterized protein n=1 Tax=Endocarpon pusillum (strain Z07020 / HMAS-L-300199) TaxID=1263415 RepID=U1GGI1_ENDPU|nr:uncharacterized protein EPUS_02408 [Endocarpon pusillum Z07020]ERF70886.1 hypothetical protein EPUS_02408 [Endocarpon pusillum Z07020]
MLDQQRSTKRKNQKLPHIAPTQNLKKSNRIPKPPPRPPPYPILTELDTRKRKRITENQDPKHSNKRECIIIRDEDLATPVPKHSNKRECIIIVDEDLAQPVPEPKIHFDPALGSTPGTAIDLCQSDEEPKRKTRVKETKVKSRDGKLQAWVEEVPDESLFCAP